MEEPVPTYQYACTACQHQFEAVQSFADDPLTECPVCEGRLRKLFGSVGVVFKGPGFYRTDSRNGTGASKNGSADKSDKSPAKESSSAASKDTGGSASKDGGSGSKSDGGGKAKATASTSSTSTS
jgi:putative FmdB family regulatory protein